MSVILDYLQIKDDGVTNTQDGVKTWIFPQTLEQLGINFLKEKVVESSLLIFLYSSERYALCKRLKHISAHNSAVICEEVETLLAFAIILEKLNRLYLNSPDFLLKIRQDQKNYRLLLRAFGYKFSDVFTEEIISASAVEQNIRNWTIYLNWPRYFVFRSRRFLLAMDALLANDNTFREILHTIEQFTAPASRYVAWLFYIPRLFINIVNLSKHTFSGFWMSQEEKNLGIRQRFLTQMTSRWFEIANDMVWFIGGILTCFVFVGALSPVGIYFALILQIYDVLLPSSRLFVENQRFGKLQRLFIGCRDEDKYIQEILNKRIQINQERMILNLIQNISLLVAVIMLLPLFLNPVVALAGSSLLLLTTFTTFIVDLCLDVKNIEIEEEKLDLRNIKGISKFGLFRSTGTRQLTISSSNVDEKVNLGDNDMHAGNVFIGNEPAMQY